MSNIDAWEKAAACEGHAQNAKDEKLRDKFRKLRDSWIKIANRSELVKAPDVPTTP